jgi:hypothetical protein
VEQGNFARPASPPPASPQCLTAAPEFPAAAEHGEGAQLNKIGYAAVALAAPLFAGVGMLAFQAPASAATSATASASTIPAAAIHHAGSCTARGDFATCDAAGNARRPHRIRVHVHAAPNQHVFVSWLTVCARGTGAGSRSGSFTAFTPVNRIIRHPYTHPSSCTVSSGAQLQDGGHWLHVYNTYRRW